MLVLADEITRLKGYRKDRRAPTAISVTARASHSF
jgi:hypothetical protein